MIRKITSIFFTIFFLVAPISAANAADSEAPQVTNFRVSPSTVDLRNGASQFTLQGRVTDVSGVYAISFICVVPGQENRFRGLSVGLLFTEGAEDGYASLSLGGVSARDRIVSKTVVGDTTDFTFSITAELPAAANSTHCEWLSNALDILGNRFQSESGSEAEHFRVIDSSGFQFENPALGIPTVDSNVPPVETVSPSTEVPHVTFQKGGGKVTAIVTDGIPGQKLAFKVGTRHFVSNAFEDGNFKQTWPTEDDDPHTIKMLVNGPPYVNANFTFSIVTVSPPTVTQRTLASFDSSSTSLSNQQKAQIKAAVESNPSADKFVCTGIRFVSQPMSENIKVRKRAKAACDYAKSLNPSLSTWFQNKPTQARSYAGKVLLTIKTPGN